jgi:hypothetical protein
MDLFIPVKRSEPFDDPAWLFDLKLDGYRGIADTIHDRMLSKNGHRLKRLEMLLDALPAGTYSTARSSPSTRMDGRSSTT